MDHWQLIQSHSIRKSKSERHCVPEIERNPCIPGSQEIHGIQWWIQTERREAMRQNVQTRRKYVAFFFPPNMEKSFFFEGDGGYLFQKLINL